MTSAYTFRLFALTAVMYVDDTDLLHLAPSQDSSDEELIYMVQESANVWRELAQATGGVPRQPKCSSYFLSYKFPFGKARLKKLRTFHGNQRQ